MTAAVADAVCVCGHQPQDHSLSRPRYAGGTTICWKCITPGELTTVEVHEYEERPELLESERMILDGLDCEVEELRRAHERLAEQVAELERGVAKMALHDHPLHSYGALFTNLPRTS